MRKSKITKLIEAAISQNKFEYKRIFNTRNQPGSNQPSIDWKARFSKKMDDSSVFITRDGIASIDIYRTRLDWKKISINMKLIRYTRCDGDYKYEYELFIDGKKQSLSELDLSSAFCKIEHVHYYLWKNLQIGLELFQIDPNDIET